MALQEQVRKPVAEQVQAREPVTLRLLEVVEHLEWAIQGPGPELRSLLVAVADDVEELVKGGRKTAAWRVLEEVEAVARV